MKLDVDIVALHLVDTFTTSHGSSDVRRNVVVRVTDDQGKVGLGEAAPYYGQTADDIADELRRLGSDESALASMAALVARVVGAGGVHLAQSPAPEQPVTGPARAAVETALLDLEGQRRGEPLAMLVGGDAAAHVVTSFTIGRAAPALMAERAARASGWPVLKVKVGGANDEQCLAAIRAARPDATLRADANGGWTVAEAPERLRMLAAHGVQMIEQPIAPGDAQGVATLTARSPVPIWVDESVRSPADIARHRGAVSGVVLKLGKCGGIAGTLACIAAARAAGLDVMIGCMVESSVAITAGAHLASLCDLADLDGNLLLSDDPFEGVRVEGGALVLPDRPGLGVLERAKPAG
jgi:L-alanine-DL-glutamate epimerase-like enolase superfamily enzyme